MTHAAVPPGYFDRLYAADRDPWRFETSPYEQAKYDATLGALPPRRFANALEVGCSIGVLTRRLAGRCDALLGVDVADAALREAGARCADLPHVRFAQGEMPAFWPDGRFDLIVLSEVLYFLTGQGVRELAGRVTGNLAPDGRVLLVNWLGTTDTELPGDAAADLFINAAAPLLAPRHCERTDRWRLDLLAP